MNGDRSRVECYYNLHKHCLSYRRPGEKVRHAGALVLEYPRFTVQPAGRERVRREGRKNVHAFVRGLLVHSYEPGVKLEDLDTAMDEDMDWNRVTYNPYKYDSFVWAWSEEPVFRGALAVVHGRSIWVKPELTSGLISV
jgi:hypothetical protein